LEKAIVDGIVPDFDTLQLENSNIYIACFELSSMADYFGIDDLILDISTYIRDSYKPAVEAIQKDWHEHQEARSPPAEFFENFINGAMIVFSDETPGLEPLRKAFVQFVADTQYLVLLNDSFRQAVLKAPGFAAAIWFTTFADKSPFYKLTRIGLPSPCGTCENKDCVFATNWSSGLGKINGTCSHYYSKSMH
jgi:hypothetical protein